MAKQVLRKKRPPRPFTVRDAARIACQVAKGADDLALIASTAQGLCGEEEPPVPLSDSTIYQLTLELEAGLDQIDGALEEARSEVVRLAAVISVVAGIAAVLSRLGPVRVIARRLLIAQAALLALVGRIEAAQVVVDSARSWVQTIRVRAVAVLGLLPG